MRAFQAAQHETEDSDSELSDDEQLSGPADPLPVATAGVDEIMIAGVLLGMQHNDEHRMLFKVSRCTNANQEPNFKDFALVLTKLILMLIAIANLETAQVMMKPQDCVMMMRFLSVVQNPTTQQCRLWPGTA